MSKLLKSAMVVFCIAMLMPLVAIAADGKIVIGYSNSVYGNGWREKMVEDSMTVFNMYKAKGMADEIIVQHAGQEVNTQIQQIRNMINQKVDVILINPSSPAGLTGVIEEAGEAKIPVVVFDSELPDADKDLALNVVTDKIGEAYNSFKYVAQELNGKGKVVILLGFAGTSGTEQRRAGLKKAFKEFPGIEILTTVYGKWNPANAEQVMNDIVAAYPQIDGVWVTGSMAMGVVRAFQNAGKKVPIMSGDPTKEFLLFAKDYLKEDPNWKFVCPGNPPGIGGTATGIGILIANGKELKPLKMNTIYYAVETFVTPDKIDQTLKMMKNDPATAWISEYASESVLNSYFK
jgi:ribose transport system substrate-binding protein